MLDLQQGKMQMIELATNYINQSQLTSKKRPIKHDYFFQI